MGLAASKWLGDLSYICMCVLIKGSFRTTWAERQLAGILKQPSKDPGPNPGSVTTSPCVWGKLLQVLLGAGLLVAATWVGRDEAGYFYKSM